MHKYKFFLSAIFFCFSQHNYADTKINIELEVPKIDANPYFRPYVAVWLEDTARKPVRTLAIWYQINTENVEEPDGKKWLKDLRQWWRKLGRAGEPNIDAVTGATRKPGRYKIKDDLSDLAEGEYLLNIEAAREEGSRSYKRIPISLPHTSVQTIDASIELGVVTISADSE